MTQLLTQQVAQHFVAHVLPTWLALSGRIAYALILLEVLAPHARRRIHMEPSRIRF
jgi:hypothetical protein